MTDAAEIRVVLSQFAAELQPQQVQSLGNAGGFSGAQLWKLKTTSDQLLCLRQWPAEHPSYERLLSIHQLLSHVVHRGFTLVPCPLHNLEGSTIVRHAGRFWELTAWMPGVASYSSEPSPQKLSAAMMALAQFHQHAASFSSPQVALPAVMLERRQQLQSWLHKDARQVQDALPSVHSLPLRSRAETILSALKQWGPAALKQLDSVQSVQVPIQFCLRDIWHNHVLFEQDRVTAIIDFGAVRMETPAVDIARLLGSIACDQSQWQQGIDAYRKVRPLSDREQDLAAALHAGGTLLAPLNWLRWLILEGRHFDDAQAVLRRLDELLSSLHRMGHGGPAAGQIVQ